MNRTEVEAYRIYHYVRGNQTLPRYPSIEFNTTVLTEIQREDFSFLY